MIALIIVLSILLVLIILCILPITVELSLKDSFDLRIKYAGITVFDKNKKTSEKRESQPSEAKKESPKENFFKKTCEEKGLIGAFKYFASLCGIVIKKALWVVKRLKFRHFKLDLTVCSDNAAKTAIEYGGVCSAVYPVITFLVTNLNFKPEQVNISTDFDKTNPELQISFAVTARLWHFVVVLLTALSEYLKLQRKERKLNERK